MILPGQESLP